MIKISYLVIRLIKMSRIFSSVLIGSGIVAAICTKPDINSFDVFYDQYMKSMMTKNCKSNLVGKVLGKIAKNLTSVNHHDYVLFRFSRITDPKNGPIFIGAFNQWFCVHNGIIEFK